MDLLPDQAVKSNNKPIGALPFKGIFIYQPNAFREGRLKISHARVRTHPLATLITAGPSGLLANLVPFTLVNDGEKTILRAHIANANDQVEALASGSEPWCFFKDLKRTSSITPRVIDDPECCAPRSMIWRPRKNTSRQCHAVPMMRPSHSSSVRSGPSSEWKSRFQQLARLVAQGGASFNQSD